MIAALFIVQIFASICILIYLQKISAIAQLFRRKYIIITYE